MKKFIPGLKVFNISYVLIILFTISCSNYSSLSRNLIQKGNGVIKGGTNGLEEWKVNLPLERYSWFFELSMYYDLYFGKISKDSPFRKWFSTNELERLDSCVDHFMALSYQIDSNKLSINEFKRQMEEQNYKELIFPNFSRQLSLHPDYLSYSFSSYKTHFFCRESLKKGPIMINFPGFKEVTLFQ